MEVSYSSRGAACHPLPRRSRTPAARDEPEFVGSTRVSAGPLPCGRWWLVRGTCRDGRSRLLGAWRECLGFSGFRFVDLISQEHKIVIHAFGDSTSGLDLLAVPDGADRLCRRQRQGGKNIRSKSQRPPSWLVHCSPYRSSATASTSCPSSPRTRQRGQQRTPGQAPIPLLDGPIRPSSTDTTPSRSTSSDTASIAVEAWFRRRTEMRNASARPTRRRAEPSTLRARRRQQGMDVGRALGRGPVGDAAVPDRDERDPRHRPDGSAAPRAAARTWPTRLPRRCDHPAATARTPSCYRRS